MANIVSEVLGDVSCAVSALKRARAPRGEGYELHTKCEAANNAALTIAANMTEFAIFLPMYWADSVESVYFKLMADSTAAVTYSFTLHHPDTGNLMCLVGDQAIPVNTFRVAKAAATDSGFVKDDGSIFNRDGILAGLTAAQEAAFRAAGGYGNPMCLLGMTNVHGATAENALTGLHVFVRMRTAGQSKYLTYEE